MPTFRVDQYELHKVSYLVENATSPAAAIEQVLQGGADMEDGSSEYVEVADNYGMSLAPEILEELRRRGLHVLEQRVPSIRSVEEVSER